MIPIFKELSEMVASNDWVIDMNLYVPVTAPVELTDRIVSDVLRCGLLSHTPIQWPEKAARFPGTSGEGGTTTFECDSSEADAVAEAKRSDAIRTFANGAKLPWGNC
jgi:hypothetical protein